VKDKYDDICRIYVPSSVRGGEADAFAFSNNLEMDSAINSLKTPGIRENDFNFINFDLQIRLLSQRIWVLLLLFAGVLLLSLLKPLFSAFIKALKTLKKEMDRLYLGEILKNRCKSMEKGIGIMTHQPK
jgi:hypothetical protein